MTRFSRLRLAVVLLAGCILVGFAVRLYRPVGPTSGTVPAAGEGDHWHRQHAGFAAASRAGGLDVVFLGDSLAWGWDDHREVWAGRVTGRPTGFFALGGDATNQLLWRLDYGELDGPPPKLVVVLIGTNNRWVKDDAEDIAGGIAAVVGRVRAKAPAAKVLLLGVLPQGRSPGGTGRAVFADVNRRIESLADGTNVVFRDLGGCLLDPDGTLGEAVSGDGTHLTRLGYERWADALGPVVRGLLGE